MAPCRLTRPKVGFEPDDPADRSRLANRAARIGAERAEAQPGRERRGGAAGRAPANMGGVPRISRDSRQSVRPGRTVGELRHVQRPERHRAGGIEPPQHGRMHVRAGVPAHPRAVGDDLSGPVKHVFVGEGHAVQRSPRALSAELLVGRPRVIESAVLVDLDEGVDDRLAARDAGEQDCCDLNRRYLPVTDLVGDLDQAEAARISHRGPTSASL